MPHRAWNLGLTALCKSVNISCSLWLFNVKAILVCPDITSCLKIFLPFKLINSEKKLLLPYLFLLMLPWLRRLLRVFAEYWRARQPIVFQEKFYVFAFQGR